MNTEIGFMNQVSKHPIIRPLKKSEEWGVVQLPVFVNNRNKTLTLLGVLVSKVNNSNTGVIDTLVEYEKSLPKEYKGYTVGGSIKKMGDHYYVPLFSQCTTQNRTLNWEFRQEKSTLNNMKSTILSIISRS